MSGDVFGNGMLLSEHIRLVAAFDHRHVFLDPDPDPATLVRRAAPAVRPAALDAGRDYDTALISPGGGVCPRSAKSIPVTPQVREALGLDPTVEAHDPAGAACAPSSWRRSTCSGTAASAPTSRPARRPTPRWGTRPTTRSGWTAAELRCRVVGEGGNLGLTQLGRIEAASAGVRLNTDAIDNSAGVDTSDHEVNIKILLDQVVRDGDLTGKQRNLLLAEMTDEVGRLVLRDNYDQNVRAGQRSGRRRTGCCRSTSG